ncbi:MAG: GTPase/DUF3482 domain-containing protein [Thermodesulfobacteriota bacterium]|nr:GTPase/DUF3482 domain-containing protein [Thermodesulfobacteriota bacterium]
MSDLPVFAFVGHPNVGKTSVLATLAECDTAEIDRIPGTTKVNIRYPLEIDGETLIQLVDTPGFDHHQDMLEWFENNYNQYSNAAQAFIEEHRDLPQYDHDCKIMKIIAEGAIVLYVVDDSNPVRQADKNEMRILSLASASRMAVINSHKESSKTREKWLRELRPNFSIIRQFNAHNSWYPERIELLQAIREVDDCFRQRIDSCLQALTVDWNSRLRVAAEAITELLRNCLKYRVSENIKGMSDEAIDKKRRELEEKYRYEVRHQISVTERKIRKLFKHTQWQKKLKEHPVRSGDIFSEETIKALGMTRWQLTIATALVGGAIGGSIDAVVGGASFLTGTLAGTAGGALAGYFSTPTLVEVEIPNRLISMMLPSSGKKIQVKAVDNPNFVAVILDWMLLYCHEAMRWSHARRNNNEAENRKLGFIHQINRQELAIQAAFIAWVKKSKTSKTFPDPMKNFKDFLVELLEKISDGRLLPEIKAEES